MSARRVSDEGIRAAYFPLYERCERGEMWRREDFFLKRLEMSVLSSLRLWGEGEY